MIEANIATYDVPSFPDPRPTMATASEHPAPRYSIRRAHPRCVDPAALAPAAWQVREDPAFYIPDALSEKHHSTDAELYDAADEHARHLRGAQRTLEDTLNLVGVLSASLSEEGDSRAVQAETVLKIVERKLDKALDRIDRHGKRNRNLFFAYVDLKENAEQGGSEERGWRDS